MKRILLNFQLNKYFLAGVFVFAYFQSIISRIAFNSTVTLLTFTPEAGIVSFIAACFIFLVVDGLIRNHHQQLIKPRPVLILKILLSSVIITLCFFNLIALITAFAFGTINRNFTWPVFSRNNLSTILDVCIYGSFYLAHWYYQKSKQDSKQLLIYNHALAESKIAQLKSQLNPHFLFNNLNILDQLIREDAVKAADFLQDFAELYRYNLQSSDKKLVSIPEELFFAESYFRLVGHKYDASYRLQINESVKASVSGLLPPMTLQLLIENAVDHNLGTSNCPVLITIDTIDGSLVIKNNRIKKKELKINGGRSLYNLREQYRLLIKFSVEVISTETTFEVRLPIIYDSPK